VTPPLVGAAKPSPRSVAVKPSLTATFSYSLIFGAPPPAPATTLTFGRCRAVSVPNLDASERETRKHANAAAVTANAAAAAAHSIALKADPKAKAPAMAKVVSRPRPAVPATLPLTAPATPPLSLQQWVRSSSRRRLCLPAPIRHAPSHTRACPSSGAQDELQRL